MSQSDLDRRILARERNVVRLNPPVYYVPEKGRPVVRQSGWVDVNKLLPGRSPKQQLTEADISNTYWTWGDVDYSETIPAVTVLEETTEGVWMRAKQGDNGLKRYSGYLLHPDKWEPVGMWKKAMPAWGFLPVVSLGDPGHPQAYGTVVTWETPLKLVSKPNKGQNPRAWMTGHGALYKHTARAGRARIHATGRIVNVSVHLTIQPVHGDYTNFTLVRPRRTAARRPRKRN